MNSTYPISLHVKRQILQFDLEHLEARTRVLARRLLWMTIKKYLPIVLGVIAFFFVAWGFIRLVDSIPIVDTSYSTGEQTVYKNGQVVTDPVEKQKILSGRYEQGAWLE